MITGPFALLFEEYSPNKPKNWGVGGERERESEERVLLLLFLAFARKFVLLSPMDEGVSSGLLKLFRF